MLASVDQTSDEAILVAVAGGDAQAVAEIYDRYGRLAYTLARRMLGDAMAAEEVVQDVFLSAWRSGRGFDPDRGSVRNWLLACTHHRCVDRLRGMFRHAGREAPVDLLTLPDGRGDVPSIVAERLDALAVRRALESLPAEQRQVIELAYFGGLTQAQLAAQLAIPLGTVKGRARLGLEKLRGLLHPLAQPA